MFTRIKKWDEWNMYSKSANKPDDMPANPAGVYKNQWKGTGFWVGTGAIAYHDTLFRPFK